MQMVLLFILLQITVLSTLNHVVRQFDFHLINELTHLGIIEFYHLSFLSAQYPSLQFSILRHL